MDRQAPLGLVGHTHVIGRTRTGKSRLIAERVLAGIRAGFGVCVVDPHGELYELLRDYLADLSLQHPQLNQRVVLFDPLDSRCPGFDPLHLWPGELVADRAEFLANVICDVFHDDQHITVLLARVLRNLFAALIEQGKPLTEAMNFLAEVVNPKRRENVLLGVQSEHVRRFWLRSLPQNENTAREWIRSAENRLEPLLTNPRFIPIFNRSRDGIDLLTIIERGLALLVNAPKMGLGDHNAKLIGAFIVAALQQAVMRRKDKRRLFWMVLDEFQNYTSPSIATLLTEVGKYQTMLLVAHQHLDQIPDKALRTAVLSQRTDLIVFSIDEGDAEEIAPRLFRPSLDQVKHVQPRYQVIKGDIFEFEDITWRSQSEIWELIRRKLTDELLPRQFYHKRRNMAVVKLVSKDLPDPNVPPDVIEAFIDRVSPKITNDAIVRVVHPDKVKDTNPIDPPVSKEEPQSAPIKHEMPRIPLWAPWP